jgi:hypothetical protein
MTGPLAFAAIMLFSCAALSVGVGFAFGRWYERTMRDTGPMRPGFLLDHTHPERALVPFPLHHPAASAGTAARPRLSVVPSPDSDSAA